MSGPVRPPQAPPTKEKGPTRDEGFKSLFNGTDLTGWKEQSKQGDGWRVENGVLIWSRPYSAAMDGKFLGTRTERDDFTDFHWRVEARIGDGGYAQLRIHSEGCIIVINSTDGNPAKTGTLAVVGRRGDRKVPKPPVPPNKWFWLEVIAERNRIVVKVNGRTMADYTDSDPEQRFARGHITLLTPLNGRQIEFRKIEIKELPAAKADAPSPAKPKAPPAPREVKASDYDLTGGYRPVGARSPSLLGHGLLTVPPA